jgi:hypothetical protein
MNEARSDWNNRGRWLDLLVPVDQPRRFQDKRIDEMLHRFADAPRDSYASLALWQRGEQQFLDKVKPSYAVNHRMGEICLKSNPDPEPVRRRLIQFLQQDIENENSWWIAWAAGLRELEPSIRALATSSPEDYENARKDGAPADKNPRYHVARQVVALWNETDPLTKAKLLVLEKSWYSPKIHDEKVVIELRSILPNLSNHQKAAFRGFLDWCVASGHLDPPNRYTLSESNSIDSVFHEQLDWPSNNP